jgi:uncharacterized protein
VVCLDEKGDLLYNETIYPHAPQKKALALKKVRSMVNSYKIEAIAIGNGTASRETEFFIKKIAFDKPVQVFVVVKLVRRSIRPQNRAEEFLILM